MSILRYPTRGGGREALPLLISLYHKDRKINPHLQVGQVGELTAAPATRKPYGAKHLGEVHRRTWLPLLDQWDGIVSLLDRLLVKKWGRGSTSERCVFHSPGVGGAQPRRPRESCRVPLPATPPGVGRNVELLGERHPCRGAPLMLTGTPADHGWECFSQRQ